MLRRLTLQRSGKKVHERSKARHILVGASKGIGAVVLFGLGLVLLALACLNLPVVRNLVCRQLTTQLAPLFRGKISVIEIHHIEIEEVRGVRAIIRDDAGRQVLAVDDLNVRINTWSTLHSVLFGSGEIEVNLDQLSIGNVDVWIDGDTGGNLYLAKAFESPTVSASTPSSSGKRSPHLRLGAVHIEHAWVHGQLSGLPYLDADLRDLQSSVDISDSDLKVKAWHAGLVTRGPIQGANVDGSVALSLEVPFTKDRVIALDASYLGVLGAVPIAVTASLKGQQLQARAGLVDVSAERVRQTFPVAPIYAPISADVEAQGVLPRLGIVAMLKLGTSQVTAKGSLDLSEAIAGQFDVITKHFDLRVLGPELPASEINASLELRGSVGKVATGSFNVTASPSKVFGARIARANIKGSFENRSIDATGEIVGPKASARFEIQSQPSGNDVAIHAALQAKVDDLSRFNEVEPSLAGNLTVNGEGTVWLDASQVLARITAEGHAVHVAGVEAKDVLARLRLSGTLATPLIDAVAEARTVVYGEERIARTMITATGPLSAPHLEAKIEGASSWPNLQARTSARFGSSTILEHPEVLVWRQGIVLSVVANRVSFASKVARVKDAVIQGAGGPLQLDLGVAPSRIDLHASGHAVDLERIAYVLGRKKRTAGLLDVAIDLRTFGGEARGKISLALERADIEEVGQGALHLDVEVDRRRLKGTLNGELGPGRVAVRADELVLGGSPWVARSWREATGVIDYDVDVDLARLKAALPPDLVPFDAMAGGLSARGSFEWKGAGKSPRLQLSVLTQGLELSRKGNEQPRFGGKTVQAPPLWRVAGVDAQVDASVTGTNGVTSFTGRVFDQQGTLATLSLAGTIPYRELLTNAKAVSAHLDQLPFQAKLTIPRRKVDDFPPLLRPKGVGGAIELELEAAQAHGVPSASVVARIYQLKFQDRKSAMPLTGEVIAKYENDRGRADFKLACGDQPALEGSTEVEGKLNDLIHGGFQRFQWKVTARAKADRFPLYAIPDLAERQLKGLVSGEITLAAASGGASELHADLALDRLRISNVAYERSQAKISLSQGVLSASARLNQANGGFAEVNAKLQATDAKSTVPSFDAAQVSVKAERFRAVAFQPFLRGTVAELDGQIDASTQLELSKGRNTMTGYLDYKQGRFQLETVGEEFQDAKAHVRLDSNGLISIDDASAQGLGGKLSTNAWIKLDGLRFVEAHAAVKIPKRDPLPIVIEGEPLADAWGNIDIAARAAAGNVTEVTVDIPTAGIRLPEKSANDLQELGRPEAIRVGVQRSPTQFVILSTADTKRSSGEPGTVRVLLKLHNVEVRRGTTLRAQLDGNLTIESKGETDIRGRIRLLNGILEVEGKRFEIERGEITFVGDPSNPQVIVTAGWTAAEGTQVYADFIGPLQTGKVTLRAEPAHSQSEILSLILFGSADGQAVPVNSSQQSSGSGGVASGAVGIGGGIATQGLNRALDDLTGLDITTRIDTADSSNPRPEVEVQVARDVSLSVAHALGASSAETILDRNFLILDWRFLRNWSLETTFGDRGSSIVDAVWQRRY